MDVERVYRVQRPVIRIEEISPDMKRDCEGEESKLQILIFRQRTNLEHYWTRQEHQWRDDGIIESGLTLGIFLHESANKER
jgi:hypothetical protein